MLLRYTSILTLLALLCAVQASAAQTPPGRAGDVEPSADYAADLTVLLQEIVTEEGNVDYDRLRGDLNPSFRRVLKAVEEFDTAVLETNQDKMAFWLNAYNVQMLQNIIETPEVNNIVEDGFEDDFFETSFRTGGTTVTLNEIEHVILRGEKGRAELTLYQVSWLDPRIHVGLNCGAVSCPRLRRVAFTPENVDEELTNAMYDFAGSTRHFRVENDRVILSALIDWYGADFGKSGLLTGDYILSYMLSSRPDYERLKQALEGRPAETIKADQSVVFEYNWQVNRASS